MPQLFPTFEAPDVVEEVQQQAAPEYGRSWLWDFERGDFVLDGRGRPVECDGHTAWLQWCIKAVLTQRLAHPIYSADYGAELEEALRQPTREAVEAELARTITETLMADPRTEMARDFVFEWRGDEVRVSCVVEPVVGPPETLEVVIRG